MNRTTVMLNAFARICLLGLMTGCHSAPDLTDKLIGKHREGTLDDEDNRILTIVLEDICTTYSMKAVVLPHTTLSREHFDHLQEDETLAYLKDRFQIDAALFSQLATELPIVAEEFGPAQFDIGQESIDDAPTGLLVRFASPVFSASGRAFVYAIVIVRENEGGGAYGGDDVYCLVREDGTWTVGSSVGLRHFDG